MDLKPQRIHNVRHLAAVLGMKPRDLQKLASIAGKLYSPFFAEVPCKPFALRHTKGKIREIENPSRQLKQIQKRINNRLLRNLNWPQHVFGGIAGRSIQLNAAVHKGSDVLVTIDIKSFFSNIDNIQVFNVWNKLLGYSAPVASLLTKLTTRRRRLPQGAPTSPALANLVLLLSDAPIRDFCVRQGIAYTNWVDDLAFSGPKSPLAISIAVEVLKEAGLSIAHRKVQIMRRGKQQRLTGLVVNRTVNPPREHISLTRSGINKLRQGLVSSSIREEYIRSLSGRIQFVSCSNPSKANRLFKQLSDVLTN